MHTSATSIVSRFVHICRVHRPCIEARNRFLKIKQNWKKLKQYSETLFWFLFQDWKNTKKQRAPKNILGLFGEDPMEKNKKQTTAGKQNNILRLLPRPPYLKTPGSCCSLFFRCFLFFAFLNGVLSKGFQDMSLCFFDVFFGFRFSQGSHFTQICNVLHFRCVFLNGKPKVC